MSRRKHPGENYHNATALLCVRGHMFAPENTAVYLGGNGRPMRQCLACRRLKLDQLKRMRRCRAAQKTSTTDAASASARTIAAAPIAAANATAPASR